MDLLNLVQNNNNTILFKIYIIFAILPTYSLPLHQTECYCLGVETIVTFDRLLMTEIYDYDVLL